MKASSPTREYGMQNISVQVIYTIIIYVTEFSTVFAKNYEMWHAFEFHNHTHHI